MAGTSLWHNPRGRHHGKRFTAYHLRLRRGRQGRRSQEVAQGIGRGIADGQAGRHRHRQEGPRRLDQLPRDRRPPDGRQQGRGGGGGRRGLVRLRLCGVAGQYGRPDGLQRRLQRGAVAAQGRGLPRLRAARVGRAPGRRQLGPHHPGLRGRGGVGEDPPGAARRRLHRAHAAGGGCRRAATTPDAA